VGLEDWVIVGMWDGMYTIVDPQDNRWAYISTQFGAHHRVDQLRGERIRIEPKNQEGKPAYRYPWAPPIEISPHDPATVYVGAQCLLRSTDRGDTWEEISPDLTTNDPVKIAGHGHMMYCTITAISASKLNPGKIWVGTDDGRVHMTPDGGMDWLEYTDDINVLGGKKEYWVSRVTASRHREKTAYVCKSGFRHDDFSPMVFRTDDDGKTWKKITNGLPDSPVNVVIEDPKNRDLIYLGNDQGVFLSFNRGEQWRFFRQNMPVVPVKDLKIHDEENDLIAGTYGRGAYIIDVSLVQQLDGIMTSQDLDLYEIEPKPVMNYSPRAQWGNYEMTGDNHLFTPNEPNGWVIYYAVNTDLDKDLVLEIMDGAGLYIDSLCIDKGEGIQQVIYNTENLQPGIYRIRLKANGQTVEKSAILKPSPVWPVGHGLRNN
jgi:hypothetical protein